MKKSFYLLMSSICTFVVVVTMALVQVTNIEANYSFSAFKIDRPPNTDYWTRERSAWFLGSGAIVGSAYYTGVNPPAYANYRNNDWVQNRSVMLMNSSWMIFNIVDGTVKLGQDHWVPNNHRARFRCYTPSPC